MGVRNDKRFTNICVLSNSNGAKIIMLRTLSANAATKTRVSYNKSIERETAFDIEARCHTGVFQLTSITATITILHVKPVFLQTINIK